MYYQVTKSVIHMSLLNGVKDDLQVGVGEHPGIIIYLYVAVSVHKNVIV